MKRKIIFIEIISTILTVLVLFAVSCIYINNQNHKTAEDELLTYSNIACEIFDGLNFEEAKNVIASSNKEVRITIIDTKGEVIIDSTLVEAENHLDREELKKLEQYVTRYSKSLNVNMMYYATLDNGYFIRLAIPVESLNSFISNYLIFGLISLLIILSISTFITVLFYNKTLHPIKKEINKLEEVLGNDLSNETEFEHLSSKINELTLLLDEKVTSLSNEKEKSKYILDNMNQGLVLLDNDGKVSLINKYALSLFGFELEHILNKKFIYLFRDLEIQEKIKNTIKTKKENQTILDLNGKKYLLYINTLESTWSNSTALLMTDITLQENMNSLKREFFANASHELKSPLTSIIGYQQLIQQGILTTNEEIQDGLDSIFDAEPGMVHLGNIPFGHMVYGRMIMHYASNMHPKSENEHKPCIRMHKNLHKPHDFYALYSQYAIICIKRINPDASTSPTIGTCLHRMDIPMKRICQIWASESVTREIPKTSTRAYLVSRGIP